MTAQTTKTLYGFEVREPDKRRNFNGGNYNIQQLWQRSHEIIGLALQGFKQVKIAEILDIHPQTVSNTLNSELGREKLSELREDRDEGFVKVSNEVSRLAEKALKVYEEIFENKGGNVSDRLRKDAADTVLMDLGGHRTPTKIDSRHLSVVATAEEIEGFKKRGIEAAKESGLLVTIDNK